MKERGMIFNAEMVRAILDGRKAQTRRIIKDQPESSEFGLRYIAESSLAKEVGMYFWSQSDACGLKSRSNPFACPYGKPGDRIWVRETFSCIGNEDGHPVDAKGNLCSREDSQRIYRASAIQKPNNYGLWSFPDDADWKPHTKDYQYEGAWRPSIHMPRWASRILLEITDVRVERLNAISQADAIAEGAPPSHHSIDAVSKQFGYPDFSRSWFGQTWQHIYGEESWKNNPWVWVIEFKRCDCEH